jgi:flagellar L-ring protein precursor FlgH
MRGRLWLVLVLVIIGVGAAGSEAGSIWAKRDRNMPGFYTDDTARQVGDVLTIIISEISKVDNKVKRDLKKEVQRSTDWNGEVGVVTPNHNILPRVPGFTMSAESDNELKGKADYKDERLIVDRITVIVEDVLPNGNLVVMGMRHRDVSGDMQTIQVSGIVRPSDINFENAVKSEQVANFQLVTVHKGVSETYNKPGWLGGVFDFIWPF